MDTTPPVPVVPLGYDDRAADPWSGVVRLMAAAAAVQGFAGALGSGWPLAVILGRAGGALSHVSASELLWFGVEFLRVGAFLGLGVAGWLAANRRAVGRRWILWLEAAAVAFAMEQACFEILGQWMRFRGRAVGPGLSWAWLAIGLAGLPSAVVLPGLLWAFFRRPEVRAACARP